MIRNCVLSASSLEGNDVKNAQGDTLGEIKDIMICTESNEVQYYVLSFGGFLGIGDKLFAIPPEAMQLDTKNKCFLLDVQKEQLENAEGFDEDNWPDMADPQFRDRIYNHYGYSYKDSVN